MASDFLKDVSEFDKQAYAAAKEQWGIVSKTSESVSNYVRKESARLQPGTPDYLANVRKLELLSAYDSAVDNNGQLFRSVDSNGQRKTSAGVNALQKALHGESTNGNPLPSQHIAAQLGKHETMGEGMRSRFFTMDRDSGNLITKALHSENLAKYSEKAMRASGAFGKLAKVGMGIATGFGAAMAHAEEAPNASNGEIIMTGLKAAADQSVNGLGALMDGRKCEGGTKVAGWVLGTAIGVIPFVGGVAGGYVEDKIGELADNMCEKPGAARQRPAMRAPGA